MAPLDPHSASASAPGSPPAAASTPGLSPTAPSPTGSRPLPALRPVFTTEEARAAGLSASRLHGRDFTRVGARLHRRRDAAVPAWSSLRLDEPAHGADGGELAALLRRRPDVVLSHWTAAHLHGLPLPVGGGAPPSEVEVTLPPGTRRLRTQEARDHRLPLGDEDLTVVHALRVTTPERTWLDLAGTGGAWDVAALVVAADHLVRHPWTPRGRSEPCTTVERLWEAWERRGRFWGRRRAARALERVRVGADSPQETRLRLALVDAGLGEPLLQHRLESADARSPEADLLYPDCRLGLQYDGATHRTPEQQARDARRDQYFSERDHMTLHVTSADAADGYRRVLLAVRRRREAVTGRA